MDNLFKKEQNIIDIYNDCMRLEIINQQLINSNYNFIEQLDNTTIDLEDLIAKDELSADSIYDLERIRQL